MIKIKKTTGKLIVIMSVLAILAFAIIQTYYKKINASVDPRIVPARHMYEKYNTYTQTNDFDSIFLLMDSIESVYKSFAHYSESFEVGVLYNNRSAALLTIALFSDLRDSTECDSLVKLAENEVQKSIGIYKNWKNKYCGIDDDKLEKFISGEFNNNLPEYAQLKKEKYLDTRVSEIMVAKKEIDRRLSVSYTNLGIIYRYQMEYDSAARYYKKALDLWERNLTAENNLNLLLGRPQKKQTIIQRLFPPDRLLP